MSDIDVHVVPTSKRHVEGNNACTGVVARARRYIATIEPPPLESARRLVMSNLEKGAPCYVAEHGDDVVGWCNLVLSGRAGFTHTGHVGMGVDPNYRRQGIGSRLLRSVLDGAREIGLERVDLDVYASNVSAIRLYKKFGFGVEGRKKRGRKLDGVYDDIIDMALFFEANVAQGERQSI